MWHSWSEASRKDHVKRFHQYVSSLSDAFPKPSNVGRKPVQHQRIRSGQSQPDIVIDSHEINTVSDADGGSQSNNSSAEEIRFSDPRINPPKEFELHVRTKLLKAKSKCQGKCGKAIFTTDT